jgi:hypothetical protein
LVIRNASALLLVVLLALACGSSEPEKQTAIDERQVRHYRALITLEAAPKRVREEVLKTCDKWKHIDHPCVDEEVRAEQLDCWLEEGIPELQHALGFRTGPRARDLKVLLKQNLCMEMRRWRKLEPGPDF